MKKVLVILTVLLSFNVATADAQTFSKMSESKRKTALVKIARKLYKQPKCAKYYQRYGDNDKPTVTSYTIKDYKPSKRTNYTDIGALQYEVHINMKTKAKGSFAAVRVLVSDKLGVAWLATFGNNDTYTRWNCPEMFE